MVTIISTISVIDVGCFHLIYPLLNVAGDVVSGAVASQVVILSHYYFFPHDFEVNFVQRLMWTCGHLISVMMKHIQYWMMIPGGRGLMSLHSRFVF